MLYVNHQTLFWTWYIYECKDNTKPIGLRAILSNTTPGHTPSISASLLLLFHIVFKYML